MAHPPTTAASESPSLLPWNIRGYRTNYHHLRLLIPDANPACICLQETNLEGEAPYVPRGFKMYTKNTLDVDDLLSQLEDPFIIMGDLNARHPYWGDGVTNAKGRLLEDIVD